jgi:hypothetical protein
MFRGVGAVLTRRPALQLPPAGVRSPLGIIPARGVAPIRIATRGSHP